MGTEILKKNKKCTMDFKPNEDILNLIKSHKIQYINAEYDEEGIFVYQAYKNEIADYALEHQKFGGPHWGDRMTWIKTSFAWMLYRCGYGKKHRQERVLKIKLSHKTFAEIIENCKLTVHLKTDEKLEKNDSKIGRIQWDPERDLYTCDPKKHEPRKMLNTRAIQIGMTGKVRDLYVDNIISIEEVTDVAQLIGEAHSLKKDDLVDCEMKNKALVNRLPVETPYFPIFNSEDDLVRLALLPGAEAEMVAKLGKFKGNTK